MSSIALRSRVVSIDSSSKIISRRVLSSGVTSSSSSSSSNPAKEAVIPSQSILSDQPTPPTPTPPPPAPEASPQVSRRKSWSFLKYGLISAVTGTIGYAGYLSYKCSYEEVDQKAKALRAAASYTPSEDASSVEKYRGMLYSTAMKVPAKALESYLDLRKKVEEHVTEFTEPTSEKLLPDLHPQEHVFTLVLDLNETLLYTDWKRERGWRTFKRPGVDAFLEHMAKFYEIVVYSDQMNMYVDPVCERLDPNHYIRYKLSRGATKYQDGKHYRDLSKLNRDPAKILYVSAHAFESSLQPENCVPIKPYKLETDDTALLDLIPFLEYVARNSPADIRQVLQSYERKDIAKEFLERSKEYQRRMQGQRQQGRFWRR
ncbi:Mitochondrial import inner membrane translocase subunit TIM50 [Hibiscus syriacus]|uniref:Mitochondrial import inner membrane translocase subunit TIM50 n=1 Tax=Hibiscus syriacus TaxID=106335 RepID=A0A6A2YLQ9_HIBSY|nr:mitochondrial import inner membrane translocase subunit TIM50-like [Hibiscus syriacus]KAE8680270.1 Mitochondrial import inner membrane translocase subunit TIM50 [Hibiscus syriacus]